MCNFSKKDILILAKAINENPIRLMSGDYVTYLYCIYCDAELHGYKYDEKDFKHDINCPVLIAQDVLTKN